MKYIWEKEDLEPGNNWGLMAEAERKDILIIGGDGFKKTTTSLRDGYTTRWESVEELVDFLNENKYKPVVAPVNPSVVIESLAKNNFNYSKGYD